MPSNSHNSITGGGRRGYNNDYFSNMIPTNFTIN